MLQVEVNDLKVPRSLGSLAITAQLYCTASAESADLASKHRTISALNLLLRI